MVGENGTPVTPDWHPEPRPATVFDLVTRVKAMQVAIPDNIILGSE